MDSWYQSNRSWGDNRPWAVKAQGGCKELRTQEGCRDTGAGRARVDHTSAPPVQLSLQAAAPCGQGRAGVSGSPPRDPSHGHRTQPPQPDLCLDRRGRDSSGLQKAHPHPLHPRDPGFHLMTCVPGELLASSGWMWESRLLSLLGPTWSCESSPPAEVLVRRCTGSLAASLRSVGLNTCGSDSLAE